jgi:hypothetical protein
MAEVSDSFWRDYESKVAKLFPSLGETDGLSERTIRDAERRLGFALPVLLRQFYQRAGKREDLTRSFDRFLRPAQLAVSAGALIFYEDHQQVVFWGIKREQTGKDDPPVWQANNARRLAWYADHDRLSAFLVTMLYRQFLEGGEHSGMATINARVLAAIRHGWPRVSLEGKNLGDLELYAREGQVLAVFREGQQLELLAAGRTEADFLAVGEALGIAEELCGVA